MRRVSIVILGMSLAATSALATTYMRVEKDGTKTYSDRPLPGGQPVDIQPAQTYSAPTSPIASNTDRPREEQDLLNAANFRYSACSLSPRNDETFMNPQEILVSLALDPSLRLGDSVRILVDGNAMPGDGGTTSYTMQQPDRGSHTVSAQVTDRFGKTVCDASTTFHVQRPNLNSPTRIPPRPPPRPNPPRPTPN